jgi:hypothetical protein
MTCSDWLMSRAIQFGPSTLRAITIPFWLTIVTTLPGGSSLTRSASWKCSRMVPATRTARNRPVRSSTGRAMLTTSCLLWRPRMTSPMTRR